MNLDSSILTMLEVGSSSLGFLSLLAYFFVSIRISSTERSVREIIEGEGFFNADQILKILRAFKDENTRLKALVNLTNHEREKIKEMLEKINHNIGIERLQQSSYRHQQQIFGIGGAFLLLIGVGGLAFSPSEKEDSTVTIPLQVSPTDGAKFSQFPRTLYLEWKPVENARGYLIELEIQDPADGSWHPHPFGLGRRIVESTNLELEFVGSQPGRWRVAAIDSAGKEGPSSRWSYFIFIDKIPVDEWTDRSSQRQDGTRPEDLNQAESARQNQDDAPITINEGASTPEDNNHSPVDPAKTELHRNYIVATINLPPAYRRLDITVITEYVTMHGSPNPAGNLVIEIPLESLSGQRSVTFEVWTGDSKVGEKTAEVAYDKLSANVIFRASELKAPIQPPGRTVDLGAKRRILWVDDEAGIDPALMASISNLNGTEIIEAASTEEGLLRLNTLGPFAWVVTDMGRSEQGGYNETAGIDLIKKIREQGSLVTIIVYTGLSSVNAYGAAAKEAGANIVTESKIVLLESLSATPNKVDK